MGKIEEKMVHEYKLKYRNILIRQLEREDIEQLRIWRNDHTNATYLRKMDEITPQQQLEWYEKYLNNQKEIIFAIEEVAKRKVFVGSASLYNIQTDCAEFGRFLIGRKDVHGEKIGLNALNAILYIAFEHLKINKIYLHCFEQNKAAFRIYSETGFIVVGENELQYEGKEYEMVLLKENYKNRIIE